MKAQYWGYSTAFKYESGGSADIFSKNGQTTINLYAPSKEHSDILSAMKKGAQYCASKDFGPAFTGRTSDGKVKLW